MGFSQDKYSFIIIKPWKLQTGLAISQIVGNRFSDIKRRMLLVPTY